MLCGCQDYLFHSVRVEISQASKALHRICGQRCAYDFKRANKCPLVFLIHFIDLQRGKESGMLSNCHM